MKKNIFGLRASKFLMALLCLIFAIAFWFMVKYAQLGTMPVGF